MKFIQLGDSHVGYRQYGIRAREADFRMAFERICERALDKKVDAVVFTGDTFETSKPSAGDINFVRDWVNVLKGNGIEVFGIEGNHDSDMGEILKAIDVENLSNGQCRTCGGVTFQGISYTSGTEFMEQLMDIQDSVQVLIMHQTLNEVADLFGDVHAADIIKLRPNLKYVALGHIHNPSTISKDGCYFTYNGSTEMNEISESPDKTIPLVNITKAGKVKIDLLPLQSRRVSKLILSDEEAVEKFHSQLATYRDQMLYVVVDTKVAKQVAAVLRDTSKHGIIYTISTVSGTKNLDITKVKTWERSRSTVDLKQIIQEDFREMRKEQHVVTHLLEAPDNMKKTVEDYIDELRKTTDDNPSEGVLQPGISEAGQVPGDEPRTGSGEQAAEASDNLEDQGLIADLKESRDVRVRSKLTIKMEVTGPQAHIDSWQADVAKLNSHQEDKHGSHSVGERYRAKQNENRKSKNN